MSHMKNDFYDMMAMKWLNPLTTKQYPEGSNQAEMAEWSTSKVEQAIPLNKDLNEKLRKELDQRIDHINPSHYKGIVGDYQYIECMEFILGKEGLRAHLLGQGYKYLMRMGKKDAEQQELKKAIWYFRCLSILLCEGTIIGHLGELND